MTFSSTEILRPLIGVRDNGQPSNSATCQATIELFESRNTVTLFIDGNIGTFQLDSLEELLSRVINMETKIVRSESSNFTQFAIIVVSRDGNETIVPANVVANMFKTLSPSQIAELRAKGISILEVVSNDNVPTTSPPVVAVPTRPIPPWAVAVIVVMNTAIIAGILLIVFLIIWRRYRR